MWKFDVSFHLAISSIQTEATYKIRMDHGEDKDPIPENTCETIEITQDLLRLFRSLEEDYTRIKREIETRVRSSLAGTTMAPLEGEVAKAKAKAT